MDNSRPDRSLTEGLWALASRPPAPDDLAKTARHVLDWAGCALAGRADPGGRAFLSALSPGRNPFSLAGPEGAMAMGCLGSILEMDDVHRQALLHPGPAVIPAALSVARNATGTNFLRAVLGGYEAVIRLGSAVGAAHYAVFHNSGSCGAIGAAAAAARVIGLPDGAAVSAMGHAMSATGGLWQARNEPVLTKHLHLADAARRGVTGALLAQAGLAGPRRILEGPQGFFAAMARDGRPDEVSAPKPGWRIGEVSFKPWPACRHAHPAIDAALALRGALRGEKPHRILVETTRDAVLFCDKANPATAAEAKFSLQHAVAVTLLQGAPGLADFEPQAISRPDLARLRGRTEVAGTPEFTARYPAHFGARVTVTIRGGAPRSAEVADAWGDPENPMDAASVTAKFMRLARAAGVPDETAGAIADTCMALPRGAAPSDLLGLLGRGP
ncbi:MAG: MmgE/PrpD family protein [Paracoccaceae bacterium]